MCHYTPVYTGWKLLVAATAVEGMSGMAERDSGMAASDAGAGPGVDEPSAVKCTCLHVYCMHQTLQAATC